MLRKMERNLLCEKGEETSKQGHCLGFDQNVPPGKRKLDSCAMSHFALVPETPESENATDASDMQIIFSHLPYIAVAWRAFFILSLYVAVIGITVLSLTCH